MVSCSGCFDSWRVEEHPCSLRGFLSTCSSPLTHVPREHPAELSFDVKPAVRLQRYLCTPAAPGRPSAAAGRCRGSPEHSMWMAFFGFEALKTNRSRVDILSHLCYYKRCSLPAISGLATIN